MRVEIIPYVLSLPGFLGVGLFVVVLSTLAAQAWKAGAPPSSDNTAIAAPVFTWLLAFGALDGLVLAALPLLGLSFGRVEFPWFMITLVRQAVFGLVALALAFSWRIRHKCSPHTHHPGADQRTAFRILLTLQFIILACEVQGLYHEPFRLGTTNLESGLSLPLGDRPLRLVQLSDLHIERSTPREKAVLAEVSRLQPDLIVLTGDYINLDFHADPQTLADTRAFLSQLTAPLGIYAVLGNADNPQDTAALFAGMQHIHLLQDELVRLPLPAGNILTIIGVSNRPSGDQPAFERLVEQIAPGENTILLYHTPDLAPNAARSGRIDLYLAGHTHGGQVRLPFYGALVTYTNSGLTYQMGRYDFDDMLLYVSRGLGMEGFNMPRARFLCPPEIVQVQFKMP